VVNSYGEFQQIFGDKFRSGSSYYSYLTSITARNYLRHQGTMTIVRIGDGDFTQAFANVLTGSTTNPSASYGTGPSSFAIGESGEGFGLDSTGSGVDNGTNGNTGSADFLGTVNGDARVSFRINTQGYGRIMQNVASESFRGSKGILQSGSKDNIRYEITGTNTKKGTFNLLVRRGNDTHKRKQTLETWNNLSLDPNADNYIERMVGNQKQVISGEEADPYIALSGSYVNKSKYIWISDVNQTPDYLDENGSVREDTLSSSLPGIGSGSYEGGFTNNGLTGSSDGYFGIDAKGDVFIGGISYNGVAQASSHVLLYDNISTQTQGFHPETANSGSTGYTKALNLLKNQDEYDFNLLLMPGVNARDHSSTFQKAIDICEDRGDAFAILDTEPYSTTNIASVTSKAEGYDSNYAAVYWPWVQVPEVELGRSVWVPPSVVMPGVYAFNDKVSHEWFAPAGLNRGGIDTAIQAARKLTAAHRDDLYQSNVNPLATFPGQGVTAFGQKTLQKKSSALDRVNVRRLLIRLKKFIASSSRFLLFEQNTAKTRKRFLDIVNPFLESVQSNSGLSAFRVVMDDSNNTPDIIDRNMLYGQIFVQPTRTAEFIILDFTVQPTGATFPE
jgi:hypothetical protein